MESKIFNFDLYGVLKTLTVGQKVECIYYHEYPEYEREGRAYKRTLLSKFIDKPFSPVKLGTIVGDAGVHPYWLANNVERRERYLLVKFKEYILPKPIPISCIKDAQESGINMMAYLEQNKHLIGKKGFSEKSFDRLKNQAELSMNFSK